MHVVVQEHIKTTEEGEGARFPSVESLESIAKRFV
jgi:hypothetical protein